MNKKKYLGWIIFPIWYLVGKKYILLPIIRVVLNNRSYDEAYLITNYIWYLIAMSILLGIYGKEIISHIGEFRKYKKNDIICGYFKSFGLVILFTVLSGVITLIITSGQPALSVNEVQSRKALENYRIAFIFLSVFIAPVFEELIFRWYIFYTFKKQVIVSIIISSFLFGIMHFITSIGQISFYEFAIQSIQYIVVGMALCIVYLRRKNVVFCIFAHMSVNFIYSLVRY